MSKDLNLLWMDDESPRETSASILEEKTGAKVHFYDLSEKILDEEVGRLMHMHDPDLVIVDHRLDKTRGALRDKLSATGATAAELIKDTYPHMPVVCVTQVDLKKDITFAQRAAYDDVLSAAHLLEKASLIIGLAAGFRKIKERPPQNEGEVLQYLGCPDDDLIRLKQVLPTDVKTGYGQTGYAAVLWRWISDVLFARPGFLYDSLWTATLVGAEESSFLEVQEKLKPAKFTGIFANDVYPRWWASKVIGILYRSGDAEGQDDPRLIGRAYLELSPQGYSKCAVSGSDLPDTVAFTDPTNQNRKQVCQEYTEEHPDFQKLLFLRKYE